ncbi:MAG TPA: hypothetical protein VMY06_02620 [Sedimentisphaerales bacterium]|nr:hypothetical protein [Sedimentisphaerales bacterium]
MAKNKTKKQKPVRTKKTVPAKEKSSAGTGSPTNKEPVVKRDPLGQLENQKPEFEQTLKDIAGSHQPAAGGEEKVERRGGPRPGSGRPKGVTEEFAAVNRLPEKANLTLIPVLQIPFKLWSKSQGVKELELNKDDAKELALPVTQLLEFYFPGRIPEIAWVWLMFAGTAYRILEPRLEVLAHIRDEKSASVAAERGPVPGTPSRPPSGAAQPAGGYPKEK